MDPILLSYGGGKDSTCIIAMDANRQKAASFLGITLERLNQALPRFEKAVFSNTGAEFKSTYSVISRVAALLQDRFVQVAKKGETITEWCLRLGIVPLMPGGSHICSRKFKGDVLAAWPKAHYPDTPVTWVIGIEADEGHRLKRFQPPAGETSSFLYPLVELGMNRDAIDEMLVHLGWPDVHKSSCVFCPFMSEGELRDMYYNHPDAWAVARSVEAGFEIMSPAKHGRWVEAGMPLNKGGRAPKGMWRKDSWADGARLFVKTIEGKRLTVPEWEDRFNKDQGNTIATTLRSAA